MVALVPAKPLVGPMKALGRPWEGPGRERERERVRVEMARAEEARRGAQTYSRGYDRRVSRYK